MRDPINEMFKILESLSNTMPLKHRLKLETENNIKRNRINPRPLIERGERPNSHQIHSVNELLDTIFSGLPETDAPSKRKIHSGAEKKDFFVSFSSQPDSNTADLLSILLSDPEVQREPSVESLMSREVRRPKSKVLKRQLKNANYSKEKDQKKVLKRIARILSVPKKPINKRVHTVRLPEIPVVEKINSETQTYNTDFDSQTPNVVLVNNKSGKINKNKKNNNTNNDESIISRVVDTIVNSFSPKGNTENKSNESKNKSQSESMFQSIVSQVSPIFSVPSESTEEILESKSKIESQKENTVKSDLESNKDKKKNNKDKTINNVSIINQVEKMVNEKKNKKNNQLNQSAQSKSNLVKNESSSNSVSRVNANNKKESSEKSTFTIPDSLSTGELNQIIQKVNEQRSKLSENI